MQNTDKELMTTCLKIGLFTALGFWACGPLGAVIGLLVAVYKAK